MTKDKLKKLIKKERRHTDLRCDSIHAAIRILIARIVLLEGGLPEMPPEPVMVATGGRHDVNVLRQAARRLTHHVSDSEMKDIIAMIDHVANTVARRLNIAEEQLPREDEAPEEECTCNVDSNLSCPQHGLAAREAAVCPACDKPLSEGDPIMCAICDISFCDKDCLSILRDCPGGINCKHELKPEDSDG